MFNSMFNNSFPDNGLGQNILLSQILTMTLIPIITSAFNALFNSFAVDIKIIFKKIYSYLNQKLHNQKIIEFQLYENNNSNDDLSEEILPIIWFLNYTKSIKKGKLISEEQFNDDENVKLELLLCPIKRNTDAKLCMNHDENNFEKKSNKNNSQDANNDEYEFYKINDSKKKFYYGISSNKFCLMSWNASIDDMSSYLLEIKNKYDEYKNKISKNTLRENQIFIELYDTNKSNFHNTINELRVNIDVVPIIWYLNEKKLIYKGIYKKINKETNLSESNKFMLNITSAKQDIMSSNQDILNKQDISNSSHEYIIMPFITDDKNKNIDKEKKMKIKMIIVRSIVISKKKI